MATEAPDVWPDLDRRRKRLRLEGFDYSNSNHVYFVTLCARQHGLPFSDRSLADQVVDAILCRSARKDWRVFVYCLMPDHLHMALSPDHGSLANLIQGFKSYTTRLAWQAGHQGILWQRSYYDHIARRDEDVHAICNYILLNPVRKGLVAYPDLWPHAGMLDPLPL